VTCRIAKLCKKSGAHRTERVKPTAGNNFEKMSLRMSMMKPGLWSWSWAFCLEPELKLKIGRSLSSV